MNEAHRPLHDETPPLAATEHLCDLRRGDLARVMEVEGVQAAAKRLADMGFVRGVVLEMMRPGRPCLVRVAGMFVGLGIEHQQNVLVDRV